MRVAVAGWIGSTNLGDELVFAGLRAKLAARGADVVALSADPAGTERAHGVAAVGQRGLLRAVRGADALVFGGGGLLQDETSPLNLPYHLSRVWAARSARTPFAVVGVGAGRLDTRLGRGLVARSLRGGGLTGISVRDADSAGVLAGLGISDTVLAADLALGLPPPAAAPDDAVVVCLRPWTGRRQRRTAARAPLTLPEPFLAAAAAALDEVADLGMTVRMVAFQADRDDHVHAQVAARMRAPAVRLVPGLSEILGEVARSRVVVGMRFHAGVAAVLAGRPAVLIGYSPKVGALAGELGAGGRLLRFDAGELARLPAAVESVLPHAAEVARGSERLRAREVRNDEVLDRLLGGP